MMVKTRAEIQKDYRVRVKQKELLEKQKSIESSNLLDMDILEFFNKVVGSRPNDKQAELLRALENEE